MNNNNNNNDFIVRNEKSFCPIDRGPGSHWAEFKESEIVVERPISRGKLDMTSFIYFILDSVWSLGQYAYKGKQIIYIDKMKISIISLVSKYWMLRFQYSLERPKIICLLFYCHFAKFVKFPKRYFRQYYCLLLKKNLHLLLYWIEYLWYEVLFMIARYIIVSWEPEGRYHYSKMFCYEPEGRYRCTKPMAIGGNSGLLVLNGTSLNSGSALLALNWRYY